MKTQSKTKKRVGYLTAFALSLLISTSFLTGCSQNGGVNSSAPSFSSSSQPQATEQSAASSSSSAASASNQSAGIGVEDAKNAALQHAGLQAGDVTFVKEKLDYDDGIAEYEIQFVTSTTKYEYEIKATDASVLKASQKPIEQISSNFPTEGLLDIASAKEAALSNAGLTADQVAFTNIELDYDDGIAQYEIEFFANGTEYQYQINASTGAIMEMDTEF